MIKVAANRYAGNCTVCRKRTEAGEGVYLSRRVICVDCLQLVADDLATNKGRMVRPVDVPARLVRWAIRENGIVGHDRMKALAREFAAKRALGELLA